jgi:ABC-type antimicrobial peptide transport system permease subunit
MISAVGRAIEDIDGTVPVRVQTLREAASFELTMRWAGTLLMGSIGMVGLLLTMVGLYGVMGYVVASRTVEIAIRMALGASASRVRREVLGQALLLVAAGVAIGAGAALGLAPALRTFLVGISPFDPVAFGTAAMLFAIVGLAAGLVPAVRGSRVAPMGALRQL